MTDRREYRQGRFVYLLDDNDHTAWIQCGHIGRCKTYRVPGYVDIEGVRYTITRIEHYAYNQPRSLRHLIISDSIEYVDEDVLDVLPNLRSVFMGKGVESLSSWNFRRCPKLRNFLIDSQNPHLKVRDGLVFSKDGTALLCKVFNRKGIKELNILLIRRMSDFDQEIIDNCHLYVPAESVEAYRNDPIWGQFKHIHSIDEMDLHISKKCSTFAPSYP